MPSVVGEGPGFKVVLLEDGSTVQLPDAEAARHGLVSAPAMAPAPPPQQPSASAPPFLERATGALLEAQDNVGKTAQGVASSVGRFASPVTALWPGGGTALFVRDALKEPQVAGAIEGAVEGVKGAAQKGMTAYRQTYLPNTKRAEEDAPAPQAKPTEFTGPPPSYAGTGGSMPPLGAGGSESFSVRGPFGAAPGLPGLPGGEKELRAAIDAERKANQTAYEVGQRQAASEAGYAQQAAELAQAQAQRRADFEDRRQGELDGQMKAYEQALEEAKKPEAALDPDRLWAKRGTGSKFIAAIAVALGAFGAALTGGRNSALDIITKAVDDDISAQRENAAAERQAKKEKVGSTQSLYGLMRSRFDDEATALAATEAAAYGVVQRRLEAAKAGMSGDVQKAELEKMQAGVSQKEAEAVVNLRQRAFENATKRATLGMQQAELMLSAQAKAAKATGMDPELLVPGYGYALSKDAVKDARETVKESEKTIKVLDDLQTLRAKFGGETLPTDARAAMRSLGTRLIGTLNKSGGFGALDKSTQELLQQMVGGDVTNYMGVDAALAQVRSSVEGDLRLGLKPYMDPRTYQTTEDRYRSVRKL